MLKSQGYSIESFAPLVRIREILKRELLPDKTPTGITIAGGQEPDDDLKTQQVREESELEKKLEYLLQALLVFCFKHNLPIKDFVDDIHDLRRRANRLGILLENLPSYVKRLEDTVHSLHEEIKQKRLEKEEALEDYDVTLELLEEYEANSHCLKKIKN
jgi:phenylalanyl-tRNA synthetase alpha subunit